MEFYLVLSGMKNLDSVRDFPEALLGKMEPNMDRSIRKNILEELSLKQKPDVRRKNQLGQPQWEPHRQRK